MQTEIRQLFEARTSVRRYEYDPIPADALEVIYAAIRNSPTSYNGQQYSVIDIADQEVKLKLYEITGQKQIKTCNRFMVFCADYHRIAVLAKAKGIDHFFSGFWKCFKIYKLMQIILFGKTF